MVTEEMKKQIKAHAKFRYPEGVFKNHEEYQIVFYEGSKFILEMPELKEAMVVIKSYLRHDCDCYEGFICMPCEVLCGLKKAGLCG